MKKVYETEIVADYIKEKNLNIHPFFVDCGAADGAYCSNSFKFINEEWWPALLIDGLESNIQKCKELYKDNHSVKCLQAILSDKEEDVSFEESEYHFTLGKISDKPGNQRTSLLSKILDAMAIKDIGVMSIDIEGSEHKVLIDLLVNNILPQILIIEANELEQMKLHRDLLKHHYHLFAGVLPNQMFVLKNLI